MSLTRSFHDIVKIRWQRFCDSITFHGYRELYYSKSLFWKITWSIILIVGTSMALYQIYFGVVAFMEKKSQTMILPPDPGGLLYPPLSVCYSHFIYWVDWDKAYSLQFSRPAILYGLSFLTTIFSEDRFNLSEAQTNFTLAMSLNKMTRVAEFYTAIAMTFPMIIGSNGILPVLQTNPPFFKNVSIVYKAPKNYFCYIVSGEEILQYLETQAQSPNISDSRVQANIFNFSMLDPNYSLYADYISRREYNYYLGYWLCSASNYWVVTLDEFALDFTQLTMPILLYGDANSNNFAEITTESDVYNIEMTPSVERNKNTEKSPCAEGEKAVSTDTICTDLCRAKYDRVRFNCQYLSEAVILGLDVPDNLCKSHINFIEDEQENEDVNAHPCNNFFNTQKNQVGNYRQYTITMPDTQKTGIQKNYTQCVQQCVPKCEIWTYAMGVSVYSIASKVRQLVSKNQTDIKIHYPEESDVLIVIEVDATTWEDFIASVGGLLGVWSGTSLITFVQAIYYLCCNDPCCEWNKQLEKRQDPVKEMAPNTIFVMSHNESELSNKTGNKAWKKRRKHKIKEMDEVTIT